MPSASVNRTRASAPSRSHSITWVSNAPWISASADGPITTPITMKIRGPDNGVVDSRLLTTAYATIATATTIRPIGVGA